jgi:hypothetical protein
MPTSLVISGSLDADGDGLARFRIIATGEKFRAETLAWGNADQLLELAESLSNFPPSTTSSVKFRLGASATGTCELEFYCLDGAGHTAAWVTIEAPYSFKGTERFERADLAMRVEPSAIDRFVASLRAFNSGGADSASLVGVSENVENAL